MRGSHVKKVLLFLGVFAISLTSRAQLDARPEILVLGAYHMANPGHDLANVQADDVLSPKRQQEITQLLEVLKKFHPTKIVTENTFGSQQVEKEYSGYLAGTYTLSNNEVNQIAYRLAKELNHQAVYPVDVYGEFPWDRVANYAKAKGMTEKMDAATAVVTARVNDESNFLHTHTVLEMFEYLNSDSMVAKDVAWYYSFVPMGDAFDNAGADLIALWFQRNIRIYSNIVKLIDSPNERILVLYGAGHVGWLRQDIENDPAVRLRKLSDFAGPK